MKCNILTELSIMHFPCKFPEHVVNYLCGTLLQNKYLKNSLSLSLCTNEEKCLRATP